MSNSQGGYKKTISIFGVKTLYAEELVESCNRLGLDYVNVDNLPGKLANLENLVFDLSRGTDDLVVAPSYPESRATAVALALEMGATSFVNLIDPTATVASTTVFGCGTYVNAQSVIGARVQVACHLNINRSASIGHHSVLEDFVSIGPGVTLSGSTRIGMGTMIGAGAVVLPNVRVGSNVLVGSGSVVTRDIPNSVTVFGNPATTQSVRPEWEGTLKCPIC